MSRTSIRSRKADIITFFILIVIAGLAHFYHVQTVPPGLGFDEAAVGLNALETLRLGPRLRYGLQGDGGSLWVYLVAALFVFTGPDPLAMRIFVSLVGVAGVVVTCLLGRELLLSCWTIDRARWIAVLAAIWMGISSWYLSTSRVAWPPATVPLIVSSSFFFLWRGIRTSRRLHFVISGLFLGLTWYTYLPARLTSLILVTFIGLDWLVSGRRGDNRSILREHKRNWLWLFAAALVVVAPIGIYYLLNPSVLLGRVFFLYQLDSHRSPDLALVPGLSRTLAGFGLALKGWGNPAFIFLLDRLTTICFLAGLFLALTRLHQPHHLFLFTWWVVSIIPSSLAANNYFLLLRRTVLSQPVTFLLTAVCVASLALAVERSLRLSARKFWLVLSLLALPALVWVSVQSYRTFFVTWSEDKTIARSLFNTPAVDLARTMKDRPRKNELYLLLSDSTADPFSPERYVVEFLYNDPNSFFYLRDNEETLPTELVPMLTGKDWVEVIRLTSGKRQGADPKGYVDYLLSQWGKPIGVETFADYTISSYQRALPNGESPSIALQTADVPFGGQLRLTGIAYGAAGRSAHQSPVAVGEALWVELRWQRIAENDRNYHVALTIQDEAGHIVGRDDRMLLDNKRHQGTSHWIVDQTESSYHLLFVTPATPPGSYQIRVIAYDPTDGRRLLPNLPHVPGDLAATVGEVMVKPALAVTPLTAIDISVPVERGVTLDLRLLGHEPLPEQTLHPGDPLHIILYWQAEDVLSRDYEAATWLVRPGEEAMVLAGPRLIGGATYSTVSWRAGEVMRQWLDTYIPAAAQSGVYQVGLQVLAADTGQPLDEISLGEVSVLAREHRFSPPSIEHSVDIMLGRQVQLLGYNLTSLPNRRVGLTLYWQALQEMDTSYKVFVHLLDETGNIRAQRDAIPVDGQAPTTGWWAGEVITDEYLIPVADDAPPGQYTILVGMYDPMTGERLQVEGGGDQDSIALGTVHIE